MHAQKLLVKIERSKMNYYFHILNVNLNFENPLRIIENYTRGGSKNFWTGIWGESILKMSEVWGGGVILLLGRNPEKFSSPPPPSDK